MSQFCLDCLNISESFEATLAGQEAMVSLILAAKTFVDTDKIQAFLEEAKNMEQIIEYFDAISDGEISALSKKI
jgi:hypothetical protein